MMATGLGRMVLTLLLTVALTVVSWTAEAHQFDRAPRIVSIAGSLLVATPDMSDPRFAGTVIYMVEHDVGGAMGLVVNRPMGRLPAAELLDGLGIGSDSAQGEFRVHYGGPVDETRRFVLHSPDYAGENTLIVKGGLALTTEDRILRDIATGDGPRASLVLFGYAGWSPGQLESEIDRGGWITVPASDALVFDQDDGSKWRRASDSLGVDL